jgi:hypothetical protein
MWPKRIDLHRNMVGRSTEIVEGCHVADHRTLMTFTRPLVGKGRIVVSAHVTGEEYIAVSDGLGNRLMVALRTKPGQMILNHELHHEWHKEYTHVPTDIQMGQAVKLTITLDSSAWEIQAGYDEPYIYPVPIASNPMILVEGGGDWQRVDVYYEG